MSTAFFISCDSNDTPSDSDNSTAKAITKDQIAKDAKIDASIDDVTNIVEDQYTLKLSATSKSSPTHKSMLPSCATTSWTFVEGVFTGTIDFGSEGCSLENGNVLKGKIILSFSNNFSTSEQMISYTFENFEHNGKKINGNKTLTRSKKSTELQQEVHPVYSYTVDMTITFENDSTYTRKGNITKEFVTGYDTFGNWDDNVFLVTGTQSTSTPNGDSWSSTIQTPLRYEASCKKPFPVSGTVLKVKNGVETLVDFGTGECDNIATITTNGETSTLELKK